jgi:putative transcriptional regulator
VIHPSYDTYAQTSEQTSAADALLAGFAAGTLSAPLHALVAGHLSLHDKNRLFVDALENLQADALEESQPVALSNRDIRLKAIFEQDAPHITKSASLPPQNALMPAPLAAYIGKPLEEIKWRRVLPGIKEYRVEKSEHGTATLYWIKGGRTLPSHTHEGSEITLVLQGAFADKNGRYGRGDMAIADSELDHTPRAEEGEDCICFAVTDAPLRMTGPIARLFAPVLNLFHRHSH